MIIGITEFAVIGVLIFLITFISVKNAKRVRKIHEKP